MLGPESFGGFVAEASRAGELVVQPRMGFGTPELMRAGLVAVKHAAATTAGTITLDSYTRVGDHAAARAALDTGADLNGYPIVTHDTATTRAVLRDVHDPSFPVQVRHGAAGPEDIVHALVRAGLSATEGGPVSYCLPYSRIPLRESVRSWARCCEFLAALRGPGVEPHLETFGGCLMGQLCPPSMLVALSVLEGLFFRQHGLRSISLSYAQQTSAAQDREALGALDKLAGSLLSGTEWHIVLYTYMGVHPKTRGGARLLLEQAAALAASTGAARLIVKTVSEAHRIPTIAENVEALEAAATAARSAPRPEAGRPAGDTEVYAEARALLDRVLDLHEDVGRAVVAAFERGFLDVPFCLHPDNPGRATSYLGPGGRLHWLEVGSLPIGPPGRAGRRPRMTAEGLLSSLSYLARTFDEAAREAGSRP
ncbi:methylaspartate mutase [Amycolatopsis sp. NPDC049688]|uniref:methylaspartate mutase n=1 Tax=Amycolatopsis sp. NPDC049688 TaxID=3154733 RepID=UPI00342B722A